MRHSNRKIKFDKIAKFNYELDSNEKLKQSLNKLSMAKKNMEREEYLSEMLDIFRDEGIELSLKELDMLLILRSKTDQILLEKNLK